MVLFMGTKNIAAVSGLQPIFLFAQSSIATSLTLIWSLFNYFCKCSCFCVMFLQEYTIVNTTECMTSSQVVGTITLHSMGQKSIWNSTKHMVFCQCRHSWPWRTTEGEFVDTDLASWEAWSLFHCVSVVGQCLKCLKFLVQFSSMGMERGPIKIKDWILALTKFIILDMKSKSISVCCESCRFFSFSGF